MEFLADQPSLAEFFGVEAQLEYPNVPFERNAIRFDATVGEASVFFSLFPPAGFGELRLVGKPFSVVKLTFADIAYVAVRKTAEDHYLLLRFSSPDLESLKLYLKPHVLLFWGNDGPTDEDVDHIEPAAGA